MFIQSAYLLQFIHSMESKWKQSKTQIVEENKRENKKHIFFLMRTRIMLAAERKRKHIPNIIR